MFSVEFGPKVGAVPGVEDSVMGAFSKQSTSVGQSPASNLVVQYCVLSASVVKPIVDQSY